MRLKMGNGDREIFLKLRIVNARVLRGQLQALRRDEECLWTKVVARLRKEKGGLRWR